MRVITILSLFLISLNLFGQETTLEKGFIVTSDQDTLYGQIKKKSNLMGSEFIKIIFLDEKTLNTNTLPMMCYSLKKVIKIMNLCK